ncbi:unnamed protein product [Darwinula stevensoni]|uniref:Cationic amino acid transporter n=1 Tax=Darwinula stevensoni TaxID=69355 RepID=A0A7R8X868_9CRUS|nr:unnamed protein product [Darwinula stevensoni]CAG0881277.1 unnamed protein product [Darwinula stevensoni]
MVINVMRHKNCPYSLSVESVQFNARNRRKMGTLAILQSLPVLKPSLNTNSAPGFATQSGTQPIFRLRRITHDSDSKDSFSKPVLAVGGVTMTCTSLKSVLKRLSRTRKLDNASKMETPLLRCLTTCQATLLGMGTMIGAGVYVLEGGVAREEAGPSAILCFLFAGIVTLFAAFCFAEFGVLIPKAGSAYVYTYITLGEFWAFLIGWNLLVSTICGCIASLQGHSDVRLPVAVPLCHTFSGYVDDLANGFIRNSTRAIFGTMDVPYLQATPDIIASLLCLGMVLVKVSGVRTSAIVNNFVTITNFCVILFVICAGLYFADGANWKGPFFPMGFAGFLKGAGTCFFAYPGFEDITFASEEMIAPGKSIPIAICVSMGISMALYMLFSAALTLSVPYSTIDTVAAAPNALARHGLHWSKYVVSVGAISGALSALYGSLFISSRVTYSMAQDGLLFPILSRVSKSTRTPTVAVVVTGCTSAFLALIFETKDMIKMTNIGALSAYIIVSAALVLLRYDPPMDLAHMSYSIHKGRRRYSPAFEDSDDEEELLPYTGCGAKRAVRACLQGISRSRVVSTCVLTIVVAAAVLAIIVRVKYDSLLDVQLSTIFALAIPTIMLELGPRLQDG